MPDGDTSSAGTSTAVIAPPDRVRVLLPLPLKGAYDYGLPEDVTVAPGDFVVVPLGSREVVGIVWGPAEGGVDPAKLRDVIGVLEARPLPEELRRLIDWVAGYTLSAPGAVLRMAMSVPSALVPHAPQIAYGLAASGQADIRMTAARRRVLAVLADGPPRPSGELACEAGVSAGVIRGLAAAGTLEIICLPPSVPFEVPDPTRSGPHLSPAQRAAATDLTAKVAADGFTVTLLDGVPGAGKTEVYFEAVAAALKQGRQVLVLLPEIALTAQWFERFKYRFGTSPAEWHSDLTQARRRATWRAAADGSARVMVGARSALFLPYLELGLIVVDEEHDNSFKQEDGVIYHARDMAVVRAHLAGIPIVLASATPSLESTGNVEKGRYQSIHLPNRHGGARMPEVALIDMRCSPPPPQSWISPTLRHALSETVMRGEQAMLFLNRRGYAPLTLCRRCGYRLNCPNCTTWLVEHRLAGRLFCHHCGYNASLPAHCPECDSTDSFAACGPGVERLAEEVGGLFPNIRFAIMTSDTVSGPSAAQELVSLVQEHELDLLIGTQIIAKSHHFPLLTLVGVVDADLGLEGGDLRAAERTYQLLYQVAGRAGRADRPGRVLLQTYMPEHPVMVDLAAGDRERFLRTELDERRRHGMPPYTRMTAVIVSGRCEGDVDQVARALGRAAPRQPGVTVLGPAPAPLAVLRGRHRRRLLFKAGRDTNVQAVLRSWLARVQVPGRVRVQVDVDPYSFM